MHTPFARLCQRCFVLPSSLVFLVEPGLGHILVADILSLGAPRGGMVLVTGWAESRYRPAPDRRLASRPRRFHHHPDASVRFRVGCPGRARIGGTVPSCDALVHVWDLLLYCRSHSFHLPAGLTPWDGWSSRHGGGTCYLSSPGVAGLIDWVICWARSRLPVMTGGDALRCHGG